MSQRIKTVFFGTPKFSVKILEIIKKGGITPDLIITSSDKSIGRKMKITPSPAKEWAQKQNIKVSHDYESLKLLKPDLCIVASFGKIIPPEILKIPKYGFLNIHPSLLPEFRGSSPIQNAILENKKETGVTIMLMDERMDEGPILASKKIEILENENAQELENKLSEIGGKLLIETVPNWINKKIKPLKQDGSKATYTKKILKENGLIDLSKDSSEIIIKKFRAFSGWPGIYFFMNEKRIIITDIKKEDDVLRIIRIKPEGKKEMELKDFLKGNPNETLKKYL